jgi:sugar lactone lactonase YvrE
MLTRSFFLRALATGALAAGLLTAVPLASTPTFWTVSSQTDFLKGDVENLSIDSDGRMFLGPAAAQLAETSAPFLWTLIAGPNGDLWAGSGNEGQVLRIAKDGTVSTFFDAQELEVHALALAPGGGLYVATSPDGKIYKVASDGSSKVFFDPDDKYIWAMVVGKDDAVYAATGEKGTIYRITPDGKGTVFYKTNTTNVVALAIDKDGNLIAGTESPGRVFKIDPSGKPFVLLDSPYKEMHAVRLADDGSIYAAAFSGAPGGEDRPADHPTPTPPETPRAPVPSVSAEISSITVVDTGSASAGTSPSARETRTRSAKGAIYRIRPDGLWDTIWEAMDDWPFDLLVEKDGAILVGTGKEGKLFRITGDPARATLLARASARQITALLRDSSGRIVGATSNPGKVFALASERAKRGTYDSDVRDAGTVATWGAIRWRAASSPGDIELYTRSGNTATPDETWSAWSKPYSVSPGEAISSPNARYLQWRAVLKSNGGSGAGPVLTSVTAAYLPRNLRPVMSSITVHPPGVVFQRPFSTGDLEIAGFEENTSDGRSAAQQQQQSSASSSSSSIVLASPAVGRKMYQKGLQTFVWKADDENDDRLQYDVSYRREGETTWKVLKRGLWDPIFVWDTSSVPDGTYYIKVSASDAPSNSPATALVGEMESVSFDIDNTAPHIDVQPPGRGGTTPIIKFVVRDDQSAVLRVEYSLDASRWRVAYPVDGIPDSRREEFQIALEDAGGARSVIIRATDAMNNVATAVAEISR